MSLSTIRKADLPEWTKYVVAVFGGDYATCSTIESVVECLVKYRLTFRCEVIRVADDVLVWPLKTKGGTA